MKTLIIVPINNEELRLDLYEFDVFMENNSDFFFLFADDGSVDNSLNNIKNFCKKKENALFYTSPRNIGKGPIIREALLSLGLRGYDYVGFLDADLSTPIDEILNFKDKLSRESKIQMITGARLKRSGAIVKRKVYRHYLARIFATFVSFVLGRPFYDTQCGAKLIRKDCAEVIFREPFISRWIFDVELILRIKGQGHDISHSIFEYPLQEWVFKEGSKLKAHDYIISLIDLFRIWLKYR